MSYYNETITYGGETLYIQSLNPYKAPSTIKQQLGVDVVEIRVVGRSTQEYFIDITGIIYATTLSALGTARTSLEALDDGNTHALVDGIHDGDYIIATGTLKFQDDSTDVGAIYRYTMRLIQKT